MIADIIIKNSNLFNLNEIEKKCNFTENHLAELIRAKKTIPSGVKNSINELMADLFRPLVDGLINENNRINNITVSESKQLADSMTIEVLRKIVQNKAIDVKRIKGSMNCMVVIVEDIVDEMNQIKDINKNNTYGS